MQDSFGILHVNGAFGAIHTRNHVIRCHTAAFAAVCMQVAFCNLHEKVENRLFAPESRIDLTGIHHLSPANRACRNLRALTCLRAGPGHRDGSLQYRCMRDVVARWRTYPLNASRRFTGKAGSYVYNSEAQASLISEAIFFALISLIPIFSATPRRSLMPGFFPLPLTQVACSPPMELLYVKS